MMWRNLTAATSLQSIFQGEFPLTAKFRSGPRGPVDSYEKWASFQPVPQGHVPDLQTNMPRFAPENWEFINQYAEDNPEVLMLSTWRVASGLPKGTVKRDNQKIDPLEISEIECPCHWVVGPSTSLSSNINPTSTTIEVSSSTDMEVGPALLVETKGGKRNYDNFEYVLITKVAKKGDGSAALTVKREFNGSPPAREFMASNTQISSMPWDTRAKEKYINFFINFATDCPKDKNDKRAMDIMVEKMVGPLRKGGPLECLGGLDLASGPLSFDLGTADYNGDGLAETSETYWKGVEIFYERLRKDLGDKRVLTANMDWKFVEYINGGNQEGLARPSDPWREVTRTVNEMLFWQRLSPLPFASIAFVQYLTDEEDLLFVQMHRLLNGYSACLGMAAGMKLGDGIEELTRVELFKGEDNQKHWLGKPLGPTKRPASMTTNLLLGDRSPTGQWNDIIPNMTTKRGKLIEDGGELVLTAQPPQVGFMTLELNFKLKKTTDFVVYLEAISGGDKREIITREIMEPRVNVGYETGPLRARISNVEYAPVSFYVRRAQGQAGTDITIDLRFQDWDDVRFRSISVHAAPDTLACEFENGVVLVNPSLEDESLDLTQIFPGRSDYKYLKAAEPSGNIDAKYMPQKRQAMQINNGEKVGNPKSFNVPQLNSIFLMANAVTADDSSPTTPTEKPPTTTKKPTTTAEPTTTSKPTTTVTPATTTKPKATAKPPTTTKPAPKPDPVISCTDKKGRFRTHRRKGRKKCAWLKRGRNRALNCGTAKDPITPLGLACPKTCGSKYTNSLSRCK